MNYELFEDWDGEELIIRFDRPTDACILIAIHSTRLGPATGGTRMKSYPDLDSAVHDALSLARGMTYKYAIVGFPRGGGKAVIAVPPDLDIGARPDLLRRYGKLIHQLGGLFQTGPDVGTSPTDMNIIAETGAPYVFCRTPDRGGAGDSAPATAWGVFCGIQATGERLFGDASITGRRILVQGVGSVGRSLIDLLVDAGAKVLFSDIDEATIQHYCDEVGLEFVSPDQVYGTECDIFAPCALGGILNEKTIPQLRCRAVAGAANNQLASPEDAERLRQIGILYAPDFVINIGGAMAITGIEAMGWSTAEAKERVAHVRQTLRQIFELAAADGISTEVAARQLAERRLAESF